MVLEAAEACIDSRAFVERAPILLEQVGFDADDAMLAADRLRLLVLMAGDHNEGVRLTVIPGEGFVQDIVEAYTGGDDFESKGVGVGLVWAVMHTFSV